jgi:tRNA pseudouridine13 synthase
MSTPGRRAESWTRAALAPPRAHGAPLPWVELKSEPEDFHVEETLSFTPSGDGPHWLLRIEKRAANTRWVAAELARLAGVPVGDVGYAGLKDRHAVTVQWFSVPSRAQPAEFWRGVHSGEFRVLDVQANLRKLKRGALSGNRFRIRLRQVAWSREQLDLKLAALGAYGAPNYFGPQRFGRDGYNLDRVAHWLQSGEAPRGRSERGFALSAARSLIFNAVLARRVQAGDWSRLEPGDLASLDGSGSHFRVVAVDDELRRRLDAFDIHPSGPLWGRGEPESSGHSLDVERGVAREFQAVADLLAGEHLAQERRALRCAVRDLGVEADAGTLTLRFSLGRGQFATAVLREICDFTAGPLLESDEDDLRGFAAP